MSQKNSQELLEKYGDIIAEEVNVKQVSLLPADQKVIIQYVPIGRTLGADFGKNTGRIIAAAKSGHAVLGDDEKLIVTSGDDEFVLSSHQYGVRYSGFDEANQIVEDGVMIELNLELTQDLIDEGVAREMSRFLNQLRKDADYDIADRIACEYDSSSEYLLGIVMTFSVYLHAEALLSGLSLEKNEGDISREFELDGEKMTFTMKR